MLPMSRPRGLHVTVEQKLMTAETCCAFLAAMRA